MKKLIATVCIYMLSCGYMAAEGYQVNAQSTKQAGMGHVGTAMKLGAESMHFNPAGLGFLDKQVDISAGVTGIFAKASYEDKTTGYKHKSLSQASTPMYVYAGFKIYDNLAAGISLTNPYGSAIDWGENWNGAHLIQSISLKAFSIQPTVSWRIMDRLSVGAGLALMFGDIELNRAFLASEEFANVLTMAQQPELAAKYSEITPIGLSLSGNAGIRLGYNVGAMFDINDKFTLGASFRSKVNMKVTEGSAALKYANETEIKGIVSQLKPELAFPELDQAYFKSQLPLPSNFNIGLTYTPTDRWIVSGEVQFVGWGAYEELGIQFFPEAQFGRYNQAPPKNYKNTRIYRAGAQHALTDRMDLRLGAYFDQTPVKNDYLNPETPSMNKLGLTAGFSFRPVENFSIDLSFAYVTGFGRDGSYTDADLLQGNPREFGGHYNVHAYMPAIGLSYYFK